MKAIFLGTFLLIQTIQNLARYKNSSSSRQEKFLSVFTVVKGGFQKFKKTTLGGQVGYLFLIFFDTQGSREILTCFVFVFETLPKFPNDACGSTSGLNGTCYTSSQCESLGGSSSGSCASSFGVCCVFSLSCGGSSSQNNTYATVTSYTVREA